jgi:hypothetical protein
MSFETNEINKDMSFLRVESLSIPYFRFSHFAIKRIKVSKLPEDYQNLGSYSAQSSKFRVAAENKK